MTKVISTNVNTAQEYQNALEKLYLFGDLTTTQLINSTVIYTIETVINTSGFTTIGDGGEKGWKQNGVTGQTPSQSPAQLGSGILNDGNGNQWGIVISGWVNIAAFGAVQAVDATAEIQAAINGCEFLYAIGYDYRYTTLAVPASLKFIGAGKKQTRLRTTNLVNDKIAITSNGSHSVIFADMEFGTIGTQAGGAYLKFDSATTQLQSPLITGCNFISPYTAIYLANCGQFKLNGNYFVTYVNAGVIIDNTIEPDSGDSSIDGGNVFDAGGDTGDAIVQIASGGLRVVNNICI
jgi:hypothetical protein